MEHHQREHFESVLKWVFWNISRAHFVCVYSITMYLFCKTCWAIFTKIVFQRFSYIDVPFVVIGQEEINDVGVSNNVGATDAISSKENIIS